MLLHGECEGFAWLATAAGLRFRERLLEHGAEGGFTDGAYRWLLLGTGAGRPQGTAPGRGDRRQGWADTLFAGVRLYKIAGPMWVENVDTTGSGGTHGLPPPARA